MPGEHRRERPRRGGDPQNDRGPRRQARQVDSHAKGDDFHAAAGPEPRCADDRVHARAMW